MSRTRWMNRTRRRLMSILVAAAITVGMSAAIDVTTAVPAHAGTGGYPYASAPCEFGAAGGSSCKNPDQTDYPGDAYDWYENGGSGFSGTLCWYGSNSECFDPWGYEYRNCTSFVAWKLTSQGVSPSAVRGLHNGGDWYNYAPASERSLSPKAGDAAVKPGNSSNPYGHVAYVDSVNTDGTITIEEYNHAGDGTWDTRTATASSMGFTEFVDFGLNVSSGSTSGPSGQLTPNPAAYVDSVGTTHVYVTTNGGLNHYWKLAGATGWSSEIVDYSSTFSAPAAFSTPSAEHVFVMTGTGVNHYANYADGTGWHGEVVNQSSAWEFSPTAVVDPSGNLHVFGVYTGGLAHLYKTPTVDVHVIPGRPAHVIPQVVGP